MTHALTEIVDRHGFVHARLAWSRAPSGELTLDELRVPGVIVRGAIIDDPLLGPAHEVVTDSSTTVAADARWAGSSSSAESRSSSGPSMSASSNARVLTTVSAIDWARPTEIPAIAAPGKLPPGAGGAIMNVLSILAERAGVTELRYAGPYPTHALFSTLARSFRTTTTEDDFTAVFPDRATRVARDPMGAVFVPAPHERLAIVARHGERDGGSEGDDGADERIPHDSNELDDGLEVRGVLELRDGIERATIDGVVYTRGSGVARLAGEHGVEIDRAAHDVLTARNDRVRAEVWFADERYAHIATFGADGELLEGPHLVVACESDVIGNAFPPEMVAALAELIAELVPAPLARDASRVLLTHPLRWADLGARAAARVGGEIQLHAALWRLAPRGMARLAIALVEALVPVVTPLAAAALATRQ